MDEQDLSARRRRYASDISDWARGSGFDDPRVESAFAAVPREDFMPPPPWRVLSSSGLFAQTTSNPSKLYDDVLVVLDPKRGITTASPPCMRPG